VSTDTRPLILIADDDIDTRDLYCYYLKQKGYRVDVADDGLEVLSKAAKMHPDLIVMDLAMPNLSGEDATWILKSNEKTKHIAVVLLTGYATEGAKVARNSGCDGFLIKPCEPVNLLAEILRVLGSKK
jgi:two-component system cell cycle response regulator DivK